MAALKKLAFLLMFAVPAAAQLTGVVDPSRRIDWSNAGSQQINDPRTLCVTTACNTVTSGTTVTAASINTAVASMSAHTYLQIPAGTFTMTAAIHCATTGNCSNLTIRGAGAGSTILTFTGSASSGACAGPPAHSICFASSDGNYWGSPSNTANFLGSSLTSTVTSGTYVQGATFLLFDSKTNLVVGAPLILDMIDDQQDNGGLYSGCEIGTSINNGQPFGDFSGTCAWIALINGYERGSGNLTTIRGQQQMVNVVSITGTGPYVVQVTPGIYAPNWATAKTPGAWWATNPVYNDGVEDLTQNLTAVTSNTNGITFYNCSGCWVKGVSSVTTSAGGTSWYHYGCVISNHCSVISSYHYGSTGDDYGAANYIGSDNRWENNVGHSPGEEFFTNSDCEGCVWLYNFSVNPLFTGNSNWMSQSAFMHGLTWYELAEGNIGSGLYEDSFHGTHLLNTQFRNRWDGHEQNSAATTSQSTIAMRLGPGSRFGNIVGNILGTINYHTGYKALPGIASTPMYKYVISAGPYPEGNANDGLVNPGTLYWGNWDNVTGVPRWCGGPGNTGWSTTCGGVSEVPTTINAGAVFTQNIGTGNGVQTVFPYTLPNTPLVAGNSSAFACITLNTSACGTLQALTISNDTANGTFTNSVEGNTTAQQMSGTINYTNGNVTLTFNTAPASGVNVWVNYTQQTDTTLPFGNPIPATQTLPASAIYSSLPSFWPSGKAWPNIGPDVTGGNVGQCLGGTYDSSEVTTAQASQCLTGGGTFTALATVISNPAMDCYFGLGGVANGTGGALTFDRNACYPPNSPSLLGISGGGINNGGIF